MEHDGYYMAWKEGGAPTLYVVKNRLYRAHGLPESEANPIPPGCSLREAIQRDWPGTVHVAPTLPPSCFHPRIYRPMLYAPTRFDPSPTTVDAWNLPPVDKAALSSGLSQLAILTDQLSSVFRVVEPSGSNLNAYGHAIRNLLLLASTEVESHFRGILTANHIPINDRSNMSNYVALRDVLRVNEYGVELFLYEGLGVLMPFECWDPARATASLDWYDGYNAVKHDREGNLPRGSLRHAISAVVACAILLAAQFGPAAFGAGTLGAFFVFVKQPNWSPSQLYSADTFSRNEWVASPLTL